MTPLIVERVAPWLLAHIAEPAIRSLALASILGIVLALLQLKRSSFPLAIWTAVLYALYASLAMPFLGWCWQHCRCAYPQCR